MVNELRLAWNQIDSDSLHPAFGIDANAEFGIIGVPQDPAYSGGIPHTNIGGLTRIGGPFFRPQFQTSWVWQFADHFSWNLGSHDLKLGFEKRRDSVDYIDLRALNGLLTFSDGRYTNSGIGDFLLGLASTQGLTLLHEALLYTDGWQFYGQDSWRVTPSFTINAGLRYEYMAIIGRYILTADIFPVLEDVEPGKGGEIQLTDALSGLLKKRPIYGYLFTGKRYDAGDKVGYLKATVDSALKNPQVSVQFKEYLLDRVGRLKYP